MALYVITHTSFANDDESNPFVSVYMYDVDDVIPTSIVAQDLGVNFVADIIDGAAGWKSIVSTVMDSHNVVVTCPFNPTVLGIVDATTVGLRTGGPSPRFVAWGFKQERQRADMRAGFKRLGLISESDTSGSLPTAGMLTILNAYATQLQQNLTASDGISSFIARPVIVKRIPYTTPEGSRAYRLPNSPSEYQYYLADGWSFQAITSQNSRKA